MKSVYASASGTGDGTSDANPAAPQKAYNLANAGDLLLLKAGDVFTTAIGKKMAHGLTIASYGTGRAVLSVVGTDAITLLQCNGVTIGSLDIRQAGRDPSAPGFTYTKGNNGIHLIGSPNPLIQDVSIKFFANGVIAEGSSTQGGVFRRSLIAENYNDPSGHSQGVYLAGQMGWMFQDVDFVMNGWHDKVPAAPATMFNHAIYNHDSGPGQSGQYIARRCSFVRNAASGPTADAGAELDRCYMADNSNDPQKSPQCWLGGSRDRDSIHDCTIVGGLRIDSLNADVYGNTIISDGTQPIAVDLPHGPGYAAAQRPAGATVNIRDNLLPGWTGGDPVKFFKPAQGILLNNRPTAR